MYRQDMPRGVRKSSTRGHKQRRPPPSSTPSDRNPPSSARRSGKKTQAKKEAPEAVDDELYAARAILGEETRRGTVYYLIDWEDNQDTGERYQPSWEPHSNVTLDLKAAWQKQYQKKHRSRKRVAAAEEDPKSPDDTQPARPGKRRKLVRRADFRGEGARGAPAKSEPDIEGSQEVGLTPAAKEIPDSYEEEVEKSIPRKAGVGFDQARVEIGVPQDFDTSECTAYNNTSSSTEPNIKQPESLVREFSSDPFQSSQPSHPTANEVSSESATSSLTPRIQPPQRSRTSFIWDEDLPEEDLPEGFGTQSQTSETPKAVEASSDLIQLSAPVIPRSSRAPFIEGSNIEEDESEALEVPDSQELRGSSLYKPSETPPSKTGTSSSIDSVTKQNTQTNTEASLEAIEFRNSQLLPHSTASNQQDSGSVESQFAQRASYLDEENYTETPVPTSAQVPTTQSQSETQSSGISRDSVPAVDPARQVNRELPGSPAVEVSSAPGLQSGQNSGAHLAFGQVEEASEEETSVGFQTQLPRVSCEEEFGELPLLEDEESGEPHNDFEEDLDFELYGENLESEPAAQKDSQTEERSEQRSVPRSFSSFTDWQASKVHSQSQSHTQTQALAFSNPPRAAGRGTQEDSIQIVSPQEENLPDSDLPASQVANTQKSASSKSSELSQASSHLPSPPVEYLRPTIEDVEPVDIKYSFEHSSSSPVNTPRRQSFSSNMEPLNDPTEVASEPVVDPTAILKAKIAAAKAARLSSMSSRSPAPSLALSNQNAVSLNETLPISTSVEPSPVQPPAVPLSEPSTFAVPAPAFQSSGPVPPSAAPFEEPEPFAAPSPPRDVDSRAYAEEEEEEEQLTSLQVLPPGPDVYEVPLPMTSYTRDIYIRRVKIYKVQLQSFLRDEVPDETLVTEVQSLLETLQTICIHPGMLDEESTQTEDHVMQAKWAENVSTKFIFLAEFVELMQATENHVVILARPGQVLDELESVLIYHNINYSRADRQKQISTSKFRVTIYPAGEQQYSVDPASFVIAFDSSYQTFPYLEDLRRHPSFPDQLAPLISLVVTNSIEHIARCFDNNLEAVGRLIKVTSCIQQLSGRVGAFEDDGYVDPPIAANQIADHLISGPEVSPWPLLPMPSIDGLDLSLMSSQPFSEEQPSYMMASTTDVLPSGKRQLDLEESTGAEFLKKQRLTPSNGDLDPSHISETVLRTSPSPMASRPVVNSSKDQRAQISALLQKVSDLEAELLAKKATEDTLRDINTDLESRFKDLEISMADIQPKYQEALNERGEFEHENNLAMARELRMKKERDSKDAEVIKLREKNAVIEAELAVAQEALATSSIPEVAEFAAIRKELADSRLETEKERKRVLSTNNELDYIRDVYQTSSASAKEHTNEIRTLQAEVTTFRERYKHDKVRIHEIQANDENAVLRQENTQLKARLKDMEREVEKKHEELRAATNGRRGTRGASMPQSPRLGNQASPAGRPGRVLHGGSRGNSPAPGDVRSGAGAGPFVGGTFGDALFMNPAPRERWRDYLQ